MTKKDLKSGMTVVTRNGNKYLVLTNCISFTLQDFCLVGPTGFLESCGYTDDLLNKDSDNYDEWDIMEVYNDKILATTYSMPTFSDPIWKRIEPIECKEMTIDDIEKALGYPIKIINSNK